MSLESAPDRDHVRLSYDTLQRGSLEGSADDPSNSLRTTAAPKPADQEPAAPAQEPAGHTISGTALDTLAEPIADVPVVFVAESGKAPDPEKGVSSRPDGRFQLRVGDGKGFLRAGPSAWVSVFEPVVDPSKGNENLLLVVVPRQRVFGIVVDDKGNPIAEATVRIDLPGSENRLAAKGRWFGPDNDIRASFPLDLGGCRTRTWSANTGADGRFAFDDGPGTGGLVVATHEGFHYQAKKIPKSETELRIVLINPALLGTHIRGRVGLPTIPRLQGPGSDGPSG
jgi:hypothetical protein